jgi:hypothetical protein
MEAVKFFKLLLIILVLSINSRAQNTEIRFAVETTFNDTVSIAYEQNYGSLKYNSGTSDLIFTTNLANFKTGNKKIDSLLIDKEQIQFLFQSNLGLGFFGVVREENDNIYHKITGTVIVNNISYPTEAFVAVENFADKSSPGKILLDLKLEINPKIVIIPYLSNYFNNVLVFQVSDGIIMK